MVFYPKVLVFSNICFSKTDSNGRTLGMFFKNWPKEKLAQFCLYFNNPDFSICNNYYYVSDKCALKAFLAGKNKGSHIKNVEGLDTASPTNTVPGIKKVRKTALKMMLRHLVWSSRRWISDEFKLWVKDFDPDVVLVQSGDSAFMLQLARDIAKKRNIPLVFFNTEGFYFFKKNYMHKHWSDFIMFPFYQKMYRHVFSNILNFASFSIYGNQLLKEDYDKEFNKPSSVLYTSSTMAFSPKPIDKDHPVFTYMGNFGFNRFSVLNDVANILHEINPEYYLNVYGNASKEVTEYFKSSPHIKYHGFVNYAKVCEVINNSDILFHVESQENKYTESLKYGFSTKVADSLASGHNFLLFSPSRIACAQYIINNQCAWYADSHDDLKDKIMELLNNKEKRSQILEKAKVIAQQNHNEERNRKTFYKILTDVCQ